MPIEDGFNKQEKEARWGNNPDTWMVALTAVLMLVGVGTAFVFYGQFSEMSAQTKILSAQAKQAHDDSIDADVKAKGQLDLVAKQVKAAQESVIAIQRQMRQDQRAWINIEFGTFHWAANERLGVPMTLINTGKTPAKSISRQSA